MKDLSIVLSGHIDHGKSTLIGRLLYETGSLSEELTAALAKIADAGDEDRSFAYVLDHLAEERENNITIDTAQVFLRHGGRHYTIIDAPGHKEFVRNMVTGASQADAALLIVAANEGIREQTRRHCNLLAMLGVRQVLVVVNKMDKVMYSRKIFEFIRDELARHMTSLGLVHHFIPMSAQRGENLVLRSTQMPWYEGPTLMEHLQQLTPTARGDALFMPVQDVMERDGSRWLLGKVEAGTLRAGQQVRAFPQTAVRTVRAIETFKGACAEAAAPWCVAVELDGCDGLCRGSIIADVSADLELAASAKARLFWMSQEPLRVGGRFTFQCATQQVECEVTALARRINSASLEDVADTSAAQFTDIVEVEIRFDAPIMHRPFAQVPELGRFTLSQDKEVCAGGIFDE